MPGIRISLPAQTLELFDDSGKLLRRYSVSTAKNGPGELKDSFCTPRGKHIIRAKIGAEAAENTVFVGRRPTGEIYTAELGERNPGRDWMLTRILWLSGCEPGFNRLRQSGYDAALHLYPRQPGQRRHGQAGIDRLHPHAQPRHRRAVRCSAPRHASRDRRRLSVPQRSCELDGLIGQTGCRFWRGLAARSRLFR